MKQTGTLSALVLAAFAAGTCFGQVTAEQLSKPLAAGFLPADSGRSSFTEIFEEVAAADRAADSAWRAISSRAEFDAHRKELRSRMIDAVGGFPEKSPLNARVLATVPRNGYTIEKVVFESMPGVYVTGLFFRPSEAKGRLPTVVVTCGHSGNGKNFSGYQRACVQLVHRGIAAFIYDPLEQGDRAQGYGLCCSGHNAIGARAMLLGGSMAQLRLWDGIRAIDYVLSRPDVDPNRIGYEGQSGGGTMTSLMMAVDSRIRVAAPSCYLTNLRELAIHCGPQDAEQNIFGQLSFGLNHAGYILLQDIPIMVVCRKNDFFPYYGTCETFDVVANLAARLGKRERYHLFPIPGPHGWIDSTREASAMWMEKWLADGKELPSPHRLKFMDYGVDVAKECDCGLPEKEACVAPNGKVCDMPGARNIQDVLRDRLTALEAKRKPRTPAETADCVRAMAKIRTAAEVRVSAKVVSRFTLGDVDFQRIALSYSNGLSIPAVLGVPKKVTGKPALLVANGGRSETAGQMAALLGEGRPVMSLDYTGAGEIGRKIHVFYGSKQTEEILAHMLYWLGESLVGRRATDLLVAADYLARATGARPELFASGLAVIPAAHAFAADRASFDGIATSDLPASWASVVRNTKDRYDFLCCVNGALRHYDWIDLLK